MNNLSYGEKYPIELVDHQEKWDEYYKEMKDKIVNIINDDIFLIKHIGSTSIKTIKAKPIIDILLEVKQKADLNSIKEKLMSLGYEELYDEDKRFALKYGYGKDGFQEKVYHLHVRYPGDNDEAYFRDYLIKHLDVAKKYEELKIELASKYKNDRDSYTERKTNFIKKYTEIAKREAFENTRMMNMPKADIDMLRLDRYEDGE